MPQHDQLEMCPLEGKRHYLQQFVLVHNRPIQAGRYSLNPIGIRFLEDLIIIK